MTTTIFVCVSCRRGGEEDDSDDRPGQALVQAIEAHLGRERQPLVAVTAVDCLAVCKRPCTVALCGAGKWTYLIGDVDPDAHVAEVVAAARSFAASENGNTPVSSNALMNVCRWVKAKSDAAGCTPSE